MPQTPLPNSLASWGCFPLAEVCLITGEPQAKHTDQHHFLNQGHRAGEKRAECERNGKMMAAQTHHHGRSAVHT